MVKGSVLDLCVDRVSLKWLTVLIALVLYGQSQFEMVDSFDCLGVVWTESV